jgi:hypothetical protein
MVFRRDGALAGFGTDFADTCDLAVLDPDIAVEPGIPRAVDESPAMNYDIELSHVAPLYGLSSLPYIIAPQRRQGDGLVFA